MRKRDILKTFSPSVSHAGESFIYQGSRIEFFGSVTRTLEYVHALILGRESPIKRFTHLILRFCYLDFRLPFRSYPSRFQYLMQGSVSPIKVYSSDSTAMLLGPKTTPQTSFFLPLVSYAGKSHLSRDLIFSAFSILCGGEFHLSRFTHLILRLYYLDDSTAMLPGPWTTLQIYDSSIQMLFAIFSP